MSSLEDKIKELDGKLKVTISNLQEMLADEKEGI